MSILSMAQRRRPKKQNGRRSCQLCGHRNLSNTRTSVGRPCRPPTATKLCGNNALVHASKQKENMDIAKLLVSSLKHISDHAAKAARFLQLQPLSHRD
jgi:hypothetical protein